MQPLYIVLVKSFATDVMTLVGYNYKLYLPVNIISLNLLLNGRYEKA